MTEIVYNTGYKNDKCIRMTACKGDQIKIIAALYMNYLRKVASLDCFTIYRDADLGSDLMKKMS
jgi:hypothetical protein